MGGPAVSDAEKTSRSVTVLGRTITLKMERIWFDALAEIGSREGMTLDELCTEIKRRSRRRRLALDLQVFVVSYFRTASEPASPRAGGPKRAAVGLLH